MNRFFFLLAALPGTARPQSADTGATQVTNSQNYDPSFAPDGQRFVYISLVAGREQLFIRSIDGSSLQQLTFDSVDHEDPAWSPDGKWIAFVRLTSTTEQIARMPAAGGPVEVLTPPTERAIHPNWAPDGSHLAYCTDDDLAPVDTLVIPVGGGGMIAGCAVAARGLKPDIRVIGVETAGYSAMRQLLAGEPVVTGGDTLAEGIAVRDIGRLPLAIARALVDRVLSVDEVAIERAIALFLEVEKTVAEGAGARAASSDSSGQRARCTEPGSVPGILQDQSSSVM